MATLKRTIKKKMEFRKVPLLGTITLDTGSQKLQGIKIRPLQAVPPHNSTQVNVVLTSTPKPGTFTSRLGFATGDEMVILEQEQELADKEVLFSSVKVGETFEKNGIVFKKVPLQHRRCTYNADCNQLQVLILDNTKVNIPEWQDV